MAALFLSVLLFGGCGGSIAPKPAESTPSFAEASSEESAATEKPVVLDPVIDEPSAEDPGADGSTPKEPDPAVPPITETTPLAEIDTPALQELLAELDALAEAHALSIVYRSGDGAYIYGVGEGETHPSASTIKAIYCQYLLESGVDWAEPILFTCTEDITSSSGVLTADALGSSFTVGELIGYAIRYSDNMAYHLLFTTYGREGYNAWIRELGDPGLQINSGSGYINLTAEDLSCGMLEILLDSQRDGRLIELLLAPTHTPLLSGGTEYPVASKYGHQTIVGEYHEATVVFAPEPYVLVVMSRLDPHSKEAKAVFSEVARLIGQAHALLYAGETP